MASFQVSLSSRLFRIQVL